MHTMRRNLHSSGEKCIDAESAAYGNAFLFLSSLLLLLLLLLEVLAVGRSGCINALNLHLGKGSGWEVGGRREISRRKSML